MTAGAPVRLRAVWRVSLVALLVEMAWLGWVGCGQDGGTSQGGSHGVLDGGDEGGSVPDAAADGATDAALDAAPELSVRRWMVVHPSSSTLSSMRLAMANCRWSLRSDEAPIGIVGFGDRHRRIRRSDSAESAPGSEVRDTHGRSSLAPMLRAA